MLVALISAFLGGLILNLMPCVFPIISLKAFGLARQGGDYTRMRQEGLAFFAGTLLAMLALAGTLIALRAGGQAVGWGFQLQSPLIVALLVLVLLGSALNLSGLFEFGLNLQRMGQAADGKEGLLGAGLTGALAVVVATPCAGPFMAGAIGFALVQPPLAALAIFGALGAGVAAPFTLLSFSPALARRLPRPGAWMTTLKQALAFPMLAAAAWLLWVLAQQTGGAGLALMLGCALLLAFTCWIYGIAQRRTMSGRPARTLHGLALLGLAAIAAVCASPGGRLRRPDAPAQVQAQAAPTPSDSKPTSLVPRTATEWQAPLAGIAAANIGLSLALGLTAFAAALSISIAGGIARMKGWVFATLGGWLALSAYSIGISDQPAGHLGEGSYCFTFVVIAGVPMVAVAALALRRTRSLRPVRSLALAGMSTAFLSFALLAFCHPIALSAVDFFGHIGAGLFLAGMTIAVGLRAVTV